MSPGQAERAQSELRLSAQALGAARTLTGAGTLEDAVSRLYYAAFHAARAALTVRGLYAKTHSGLIGLFHRTFWQVPLLDSLFEVRAAADYEFEKFTATKADVERLIEETSGFIERCRQVVEEAVERGPNEPDPPPDL